MKRRRLVDCFTPSFLPPYSLTSIVGSPLAMSEEPSPGAFASLMGENSTAATHATLSRRRSRPARRPSRRPGARASTPMSHATSFHQPPGAPNIRNCADGASASSCAGVASAGASTQRRERDPRGAPAVGSAEPRRIRAAVGGGREERAPHRVGARSARHAARARPRRTRARARGAASGPARPTSSAGSRRNTFASALPFEPVRPRNDGLAKARLERRRPRCASTRGAVCSPGGGTVRADVGPLSRRATAFEIAFAPYIGMYVGASLSASSSVERHRSERMLRLGEPRMEAHDRRLAIERRAAQHRLVHPAREDLGVLAVRAEPRDGRRERVLRSARARAATRTNARASRAERGRCTLRTRGPARAARRARRRGPAPAVSASTSST